MAYEDFPVRAFGDDPRSIGRRYCTHCAHHPSLLARIGLFLGGFILLALYGTSLNLAPVEFATVTGMYVGILFVVFQIANVRTERCKYADDRAASWSMSTIARLRKQLRTEW
jgi:hypothetical protein